MAISDPNFTTPRSGSNHASADQLTNRPSPSTNTIATFMTASEEFGAIDEHEEPESYEDDIGNIHTEGLSGRLLSKRSHLTTLARNYPCVPDVGITGDSESESSHIQT